MTWHLYYTDNAFDTPTHRATIIVTIIIAEHVITIIVQALCIIYSYDTHKEKILRRMESSQQLFFAAYRAIIRAISLT